MVHVKRSVFTGGDVTVKTSSPMYMMRVDICTVGDMDGIKTIKSGKIRDFSN